MSDMVKQIEIWLSEKRCPVKHASVILFVLFVLVAAAAQESTQIPKGIQEAEKAQAAIEKSIPSPQIPSQRTPADFQRDADQLATLAQSIPTDLNSVSRGMLPKDVIQKLKQIEKLAKHLRSELNPQGSAGAGLACSAAFPRCEARRGAQ
jgi:predicted PurR-regulated permease PerM